MKVHAALLVLASVVALAHTGCAALQHNAVKDEGSLLLAAGFEAIAADSPQRLAYLASMPPHRLVSQTKDDQFVYLYADPDYCRCFYIGSPQQYSVYQRLVLEQKVAEERLTPAVDWDDWNSWDSWWW